VLQRSVKRPKLTAADRLFWAKKAPVRVAKKTAAVKKAAAEKAAKAPEQPATASE
jgi:hypothetical protein